MVHNYFLLSKNKTCHIRKWHQQIWNLWSRSENCLSFCCSLVGSSLKLWGKKLVRQFRPQNRFFSEKKKKKSVFLGWLIELERNIWAATWQNQQNDCAPSEDSDQSGHPPSLIRVFAVRMKKAWVLSYPLSAQRRLWSDWADSQAGLVFAGRTVTVSVSSCRGSYQNPSFETRFWPVHTTWFLANNIDSDQTGRMHRSWDVQAHLLLSCSQMTQTIFGVMQVK